MAEKSTSKWTKYKILAQSSALLPYLPKTYPLKKKYFWRLLDKYEQVIVKPTGSWGGRGVILIKDLGSGMYEVHKGDKKKKVSGADLYDHIKERTGEHYIVQKRIPLATVKGSPFDLRVMVQRRPHSPWAVTGKLAKVAGKGYIVTNVRRSKGYVTTVHNAIREIKGISEKSLLSRIDKVAVLSAEQLKKKYSWARTMGVDMGVDKKGKPWIIEVNFKPMLSLFQRLKDKSMYRKIVSYSKK